MPTAYIALGANLGDREANILGGLRLLKSAPGINIARVSTLMEFPAVGGPSDSPPFLNAAAELITSLSPIDLLQTLLQIERSLGRQRTEKWGPRTIDLDLLLYENQILHADHLTLPHPRMHDRPFVLLPLSQIASEVIHPTLKMTIGELARSLE